MKAVSRLFKLIILTVILTSLLAPMVSAKDKEGFAPDEVIIKFKPDKITAKPIIKQNLVVTGIKSIDNLNKKHKAILIKKVFKKAKKPKIPYLITKTGKKRFIPDLSSIYKITLPKDADILSIIEEYKKDPNIEYAEPNYIYQTCETIPNEYADRTALANAQWALDKIDAPDAWDIETGNTSVIIAIIDTGVDLDHPDLADNIWINEAELNGAAGEDDDGNGHIDDIRG
ncbi:hypothetical protein KAU11_12235 [Candidatus Babeliales bacterium]|nr:hypothetical protein [Candidatus Babeliales bacterium]